MTAGGGVADAEALGRACREVLDHDVGVPDQISEHRARAGRLQVECDASLAAVAVEEREGVVRIVLLVEPHPVAPDIGGVGPGQVSPVGILDLDHVGAKAGQQMGPERSRKGTRQVDDDGPR